VLAKGNRLQASSMNWLPPNGALDGVTLDNLLRWNLATVFWLFVAAQVLLVVALLWRLRPSAAPPATEIPGRPGKAFFVAEFLVLLAVTALYIAMDFTGHQLWAARREAGPAEHPLRVEVTGVQFQWYFRYPGADEVYGRIRPSLVSAPNGNPLGLDPTDPHSQDDVVSSILVLPAGRPVDLRLRSQDVIHGLFIPGMRLKQDAIPGMTGHLQFTPTVPGDFVILCSQVCGLGHARMQARLRVVPTPDYERWISAREKSLLADASAARP
jgi:cytochrome c oxidase subunit 2